MREALLSNLKGCSLQELKQIIDDGISSKEETILVGLGVLFEKYYLSLEEQSKERFLNDLLTLLETIK